MVDFSNFSNTDFNTTPFQYVVFGKGGSLLEVELNEAQYLGFLRDRESLRNLGNRCINGEVKSNGTDITITGDLIINGYYIHSLNSTIKSVGLPKFLYAKVSIIDYTGNSVVKNNGYIDGNIIPNTIIDSRMGFETTRRRGIQLEFSTIDSNGAIKLLEEDGLGGIRFAIPTMTLSDSVDKAVSELKTNIQSIETELNSVVATSEKGSANGVATLDANGKIPSSQLPSYVDDVIEYPSKASFPTTGETSKIYVDTTANLTYRWGGSEYVEISPSLAIGETSSTAYRGDRGKVAYDHSQSEHAPSNAQQNVQSDWNATSGDSFIKNKPSSLPASDVHDWAKASSKPSYSWSEITGKPSTFAPSSHTHNYAGSSSAGGSANSSIIPYGFQERTGSATWGNQTGTYVTDWNDPTGGSIQFRRDNPSSGKLSAIIDGFFYQNEGKYRCLDTSDSSGFAKSSHSHSNYLPRSGGTVTGTLYFNNGSSAESGYISHTNSSLTICAPRQGNGDYDLRATGLTFKSCFDGILPNMTGDVFGFTDGTSMNLGSPSYKFGTIYAINFQQTSSDKKLKKDIEPLSNEITTFTNLFDKMEFVKFRWKDNNNGALETKPSCRYHYGVIAQEVENLMHENGLTNYDNGFIHSGFFLDNFTDCFITGGYRCAKEGYDYSENVYNYKNGLEYETYNEVIEKPFSELDIGARYIHRPKIQYIMFQDISKVRKKGKQPPLTINSIHFVDKDGNYIPIKLSTEGAVSCYDPDEDITKANGGSCGTINDDGSLTVTYDDMWCSYMIKIAEDDNCYNFYDYESIVVDVDFIGEYKVYLIPKGEYQNCNFWNDRDRCDKVAYDYSFNYQEFTNMGLAVLQNTRKEYKEYKAESERRISELENEVAELKDLVNKLIGGTD